ncbi:uncharacterized protein [Drosophila bipectinata]|uniref:uncharacterized protein n=1 Tax=Drosophila bipectinata TaxID=42026 RepID=UPI001C898D88|nr:uncharacterized protein LOC122322272 [Drosophila bipectinata]
MPIIEKDRVESDLKAGLKKVSPTGVLDERQTVHQAMAASIEAEVARGYDQGSSGRGAIPKVQTEVPSEIRSAVNTALFQAQQTYESGKHSEFNAFKEQMEADMMLFMKDINDCRASWRKDFESQWMSQQQQQPAESHSMKPPERQFQQPPPCQPTARCSDRGWQGPASAPPTGPKMQHAEARADTIRQVVPLPEDYSKPPPNIYGKQDLSRPPERAASRIGWEARGYQPPGQALSLEMEPEWDASYVPSAMNQAESLGQTRGSSQARMEVGHLRKWGLLFDGSPRSMPVSEFVFRLEHLQRSYRIPWSEVLREFHVLVEGPAREWYWMYIRTNGKTDWPYLQYALQKQFQSHRSNFEREYELRERKQRSGESVEAYIQMMLTLRARLETPVSDFERIKIIKMNLRERISKIVYPIHVTNLEQLRHECHDAERMLATRWSRQTAEGEHQRGFSYRPRVEEVEDQQEDEDGWPEEGEVEALHRQEKSRDKSTLNCWNCNERGNTFWELNINKQSPTLERSDGNPSSAQGADYKEGKPRCFQEYPVTPRIERAQRRTERQRICAAIRAAVSGDNRPFAIVEVEGNNIEGLLDSGASVSLLGEGCLELIEKLGLRREKTRAIMQSAGGAKHQVLGKVYPEIRYQGQTHRIPILLCPSLKQKLYLGVDFWRKFHIAPEVVRVESLENVETEIHSKGEPVEPHTLTKEQKERLDKVKEGFLAYENQGLGLTTMEQHTIKLVEGAVPVKERFYPVSPAKQQLLFAEVDEMLRLGVIELSESPWNNRTTLVQKPGKNRLCLDARKLNALTVKDAYPLQNIESILSRVDDTIYISSIDLKHAFWQVELEERSRPYTAFTIPGRPLYQFRRMPFGLCNAAQRLCRLMDRVIPQRLRDRVFVYLDDLLMISKTFEEHCELLTEVGNCLRKANLTIGLQKSKFCFKYLRYLGYVLGDGALKTDPRKIAAIKEIEVPKNVRQLRSFLGTANWYRRFIQNFSEISAPLTDCLKRGKGLQWTPEAEVAFQKLKQAVTCAPVLTHPDFRKHFWIQCDASHVGIGAVLFQKDDDKAERPIAYFSAKLRGAQLNYSVTEIECLAAVKAVERFRPYIEMMPFTILTDHASLKWLMSFKNLEGRLARWFLALQPYQFNIDHRKGKDNVVADTLSRPNEVEELSLVNMETTAFAGSTGKE